MGIRGEPRRFARGRPAELRLTDAQARGLRAMCLATGRTRADLVREAIEAFLTNNGFAEPNQHHKEGNSG